MAPRRQVKQTAAESIAAAADGNVTPPKKRKTVATKPATMDEPKQTKTRVRQAKAVERYESASPPKKSRGKSKNTAAAVAPKNAAAKNNTKSKLKKSVNKRQEETAAEDNDAVEEITEQVVEKKARGGKTTMAKKAGTKPTTMKSKAKVPAIKKQKNEAAVENGAENSEKKNAVGEDVAKRTTRRGKAVEESAAPATVQPAKVSRKRRNVQEETITESEETQVIKETKDEAEDKVPSKKPRGRAKKTETNNASEVISKGKPKKKSVKVEVAKPLSEETETEEQSEQNIVMQKNNSKAKNIKNTKKRNAKKAAPKGKRNAVEKHSDIQLEEIMTLETDIKENGEAETVQTPEPKQKKKNTGKTNVATDGKTELKGRQKKVQMATIDEVEGTKYATMKDEPTEKVSLISETLNGDDVSFSKNNSTSQVKGENSEANENTESMKNVETLVKEQSSDNRLERSATFICFEKNENC